VSRGGAGKEQQRRVLEAAPAAAKTPQPVPASFDIRRGAWVGTAIVGAVGLPIYGLGIWAQIEESPLIWAALAGWALTWMAAYYVSARLAGRPDALSRSLLVWATMLALGLVGASLGRLDPWLASALVFGIGAGFVLPSGTKGRPAARSAAVSGAAILLMSLVAVDVAIYPAVPGLIGLAAYPVILGIDTLLDRTARRA
jgi:hypothetical protein